MAKTIVLDIETAPLPQEQLQLVTPDFQPDPRLKDPQKIAESLRAKREKFFEDAALSALTAHVQAIGTWRTGEAEPSIHIEAESILMQRFNEIHKEPLITFNGKRFDIPFLCRRGVLYGFNWFDYFYAKNGFFNPSAKVIDLMEIWDCGRKDYISLATLAKYTGVGDKNADSQLFHELLAVDKEKAIAYLKNDLYLTQQLAKKWGYLET